MFTRSSHASGHSAVIGYVLGMIVSGFVVRASQEGGAAILMPWPMAVGMFFLTLPNVHQCGIGFHQQGYAA